MNKMTFTKITGIFSTLFFAFAMTANAQKVTISEDGTVMTYDFTVQGEQNKNTKIQDLNLNNEQRAAVTKLVVVGKYVKDDKLVNPEGWGIQTIDLSQADLTGNTNYAFSNMYELQEVIWPTTPFVIPNGAFQTNQSKWTTVTIPSNCTDIYEQAFARQAFETITITGPATYIHQRAFDNVKKVKDVYVLSGEEVDANGNYYCQTTAFDFWITWVQTQIDRISEAATLHIPSDAKNIDNFRIPGIDVLTQEVLSNTYHSKSKNGWHEFIKNTESIVASDQVFRTFSDTKDHLFPKCTDINQGVKVYYVVGVTEVNNKEKILIEPLNEESDYLLPANTGVLVYTKKGVVIYNTETESGEQKVAQYAAKTPKGNTNYLESLQDAPDEYYLSWSSIRRGKNCVNMFLNNKRDIDPSPREWGFYTIIPKVYTKDVIGYHAYLNMPTEIMNNTSMYGFWDGNGDVPPSINNGKVFELDVDDMSEATMIVNTKIDNDQISSDNAYYNVNGQKINEPVNGLYIHAGKKYMK